MSSTIEQHEREESKVGATLRQALLANLPFEEERHRLAGINSAVLTGGDGPPMLLLHGAGANVTHWRWVLPGLVARNRVIVPDLPGHGAIAAETALDVELILDWMGELIDRTCPVPPVVVGHNLGGAIALRFAAKQGRPLDRLIVVDTLGLTGFYPAPGFGAAIQAFLAEPGDAVHDELWRYCAYDLDGLLARIGPVWSLFKEYNLDRARDPAVLSAVDQLLRLFGIPAIQPEEFSRIRVPTSVIWGRHDLATPLVVAETVATRYGWPLQVIEQCADDPPVEQPDQLARLLSEAAAKRTG